MKATAKEVNISRTSLRRIINQDLGLKALKMQHRKLISAASKKNWLDRGKMMLQEIQSDADKVLVWSDEKIFTVQAVVSSQNHRVYAHSTQHLPEGCRTHFCRQEPAGVMVWAAVASDGSKSPLVFIQEGVEVNSQVYLQVLEEKVLPCCTNAFGNQYVFTQDGAPAHTSNVTQAWCKQHFPDFWDKNMWPPSSPDINPMDFVIWSILEREVSRVSHSSVTALKTALMKSWSKTDAETVQRSCQAVPGCLQAIGAFPLYNSSSTLLGSTQFG